jgi:hypothetical protein
MDILAFVGICLGVMGYLLPQMGIEVIPTQYAGPAILVGLGLCCVSLFGAIRGRRQGR